MTYPVPPHADYPWQNAPSTNTPLDKAHLQAAEDELVAFIQATANQLGVVATTPKTTGYTAAAGDFVPVDTTSVAVTVTLPAAPADASRVGVTMIAGGNTCTVACGGTDTLRKAGGSTSQMLALYQTLLLQYQASTGVWHVHGVDPLGAPPVPFSIKFKTANYTAVSGDVVFGDATSGAFTVTLPSGSPSGQQIEVKKTDSTANAVTVAGTIDGVTNFTLATQNQTVVLVADGTNWRNVSVVGAAQLPAAAVLADSGAGPQLNASTVKIDQNLLYYDSASGKIKGKSATAATGVGFGSVVTKTGNYTVVSGDLDTVFQFNGASLIATLPATAPAAPWSVTILNINASGLTVSPNGRNLNGSASSITLSQNQATTVWSDGTNYEYGASVPSVFGRTGAITAQTGDYTAAQVTGAEQTANKDANSGYAGLNAQGLVNHNSVPESDYLQNGVVAAGDLLASLGAASITNGGTVTYSVAAGTCWVKNTSGLLQRITPSAQNSQTFAASITSTKYAVYGIEIDTTGTLGVVKGTETATQLNTGSLIASNSPAVTSGKTRIADIAIRNNAGTYQYGDGTQSGSQGVNWIDRRPWARGAFYRILWTAGSYTISATSGETIIDATNLSVRMECAATAVQAKLVGVLNAGSATALNLWQDGAPYSGTQGVGILGLTGGNVPISLIWDVLPSSGSHLFQPVGYVGSTASTLLATTGNPLLFELREIVAQNANNGTA